MAADAAEAAKHMDLLADGADKEGFTNAAKGFSGKHAATGTSAPSSPSALFAAASAGGASHAGLGRTSPDSKQASTREAEVRERELVGKLLEVRGHAGRRPEINGIYVAMRELWSGRTVYRNRSTKVYLIWNAQPPRWKIMPCLGSMETLAYIESAADCRALPFEAPGPWFIVGCPEGGLPEEMPDEAVECTFHGQTVVVSGRSGYNQRLNGIYEELPEAYGAFSAYADHQKHLFIFRRLNAAVWVISNRLGPSRAGRGVSFAEVEDDVPQPYLVTRPWTVCAWAGRKAEQDPNISVFLRAKTYREGPPPAVLTVRSKTHPEAEGTYIVRKGEQVNECIIYVRAATEPGVSEKFLFWDSERWCISSSVAHRKRECDACSQRRDASGRHYPDDAVWPGIEVLPGDSGIIDAPLLALLRGRITSLTTQFS